MQTGSWYLTKGMPGRVGISVGGARGVAGPYAQFRALAPTREMLGMSTADYAKAYAAILARLNPQEVWDQLHALAGGAEPILLCHEKPPFHAGNLCHRRRVAAWFKETLGHDVPELNYTGPDGY